EGLHAFGAQARREVVVCPALEDPLWRPPGHPAVDDGAAADAATFDVGDGWRAHDHRRARVAVKAWDALGDVGVEARGRLIAAVLDEDDLEAGFGELGPTGSASRAGADDDDVGALLFDGAVVFILEDAHVSSGCIAGSRERSFWRALRSAIRSLKKGVGS